MEKRPSGGGAKRYDENNHHGNNITDSSSLLPISINIAPASRHMKSPLLKKTLSPKVFFIVDEKKPQRLIGDNKAYDDSDPLDERS